LLLELDTPGADLPAWKRSLSALIDELEADPATEPIILARARVDVARAFARVEDHAQAEALLRQALAALDATDKPDALEARRALGSVTVSAGRAAEGLQMLEAVLEREIEVYGPDSLAVARTRIGVGRALVQLRRFDEAEALLLHTEEGLRAMDPPPGHESMLTANALGELYAATGRSSEAERRFDEARGRGR
jgi:tetratricopeptide (TPR) repeat protein